MTALADTLPDDPEALKAIVLAERAAHAASLAERAARLAGLVVAGGLAYFATLVALGLRKLNSTTVQPDNAATRGKIFKVKHLVKVEEA